MSRAITLVNFLTLCVTLVSNSHASSQPTLVWSRTYHYDSRNLNTINGDISWSVATDSQNNIYLVGRVSSNVALSPGLWLGKYDSLGNLLWTRTFAGVGPGANGAFSYGVTVGADDNVYLTGSSSSSIFGTSLLLQKYDSNGNLQWSRTFTQTGQRAATGLDIAVSGSAIFVAGVLTGYVLGDHGRVFVKYDLNGNLQGSSTMFTNLGFVFFYDDKNTHVRSHNGKVYWAGQRKLSDGFTVLDWIRVTDENMNLLWEASYSTTGLRGFDVHANGIFRVGLAASGFGGGSLCTLGRTGFNVIKHSFNGALLWSHSSPFLTQGVTTAAAYAVKITNDERILVSGSAGDSVLWSHRILLSEFYEDGRFLWSYTTNGTADLVPGHRCFMDRGVAIGEDSNGDIIVAGILEARGSPEVFKHIWIGKYQLPPPIVLPPLQVGGTGLVDLQNLKLSVPGKGFFNPSLNESLSIELDVSGQTYLHIRIYDLRGDSVRTIYDNASPLGSFTKIWDGRNKDGEVVASGLYFVVVETSIRRHVRRIIVKK